MKKITSKMCMTKDVGQHGYLFGGNMMAWMDEAAAIFAMQETGEEVVSVRFAEMLFKHPVRERDVVEFYCDNLRRGRTSLTFEVIAIVRGERVFSTECTFVAIDVNAGMHPKVINWNRSN